MSEENWVRLNGLEASTTVRLWQNGEMRIHIEDVRDSRLHNDSFIAVTSEYKQESFESLCEAAEYVINEYGLIPEGSAWEHKHLGDRYIITDTDPDDAHHSEPFVRCEVPDYETRDEVFMARRLFESQLELLDWNLVEE